MIAHREGGGMGGTISTKQEEKEKEFLTDIDAAAASHLIHKRPTWNTTFAGTIAILRAASAKIPRNITAIRLLTDHQIPTWLPTLPSGVVTETSTIPAGEWFYPKQTGLHIRRNASPIAMSDGQFILYFHGGAFCCCSSATHRGLLIRLVSLTGATILAVDYRRPPEHPYPIPLDDCLSSYLYILEKVGDSSRIILAGDSAGGNLVISTLLRIGELGLQMPRGGILLSPWVDLTDIGSTSSWKTNEQYDYLAPDLAQLFAECYLGPTSNGSDEKNDSVQTNEPSHPMTHLSPLYSPHLHLLPPLLVEFGECEVLHDQILAFCQKCQDAGVEVEFTAREDMVHVFPIYTFSGMKQCEDAINQIVFFVNKLFYGHQGVSV